MAESLPTVHTEVGDDHQAAVWFGIRSVPTFDQFMPLADNSLPRDDGSTDLEAFLISQDRNWMFNAVDEYFFNVQTQQVFPAANPGEINNAEGAAEDRIKEDGTEEDVEDEDDLMIDFEKDLYFESYTCQGKKETNEDRVIDKETLPLDIICSSEACCFFTAVIDGHGGSGCADYCKAHLSNCILSSLRDLVPNIRRKRMEGTDNISERQYISKRRKNRSGDNYLYSIEVEALRRACERSFVSIDTNFLHRANRTKNFDEGSVVALAMLYGPDDDGALKLICAHVGDCRIVLCRAGEAIALTNDHSPEVPKEKKRIETEGGKVIKLEGIWRVLTSEKKTQIGLSISRAVGDLRFKKPKKLLSNIPDVSIHTIDFESDLFIVLATDGIWSVLSNQEVVDRIMGGLRNRVIDLKATLLSIVKEAEARGSVDDKSLSLILFGWHLAPPPDSDDQIEQTVQEDQEDIQPDINSVEGLEEEEDMFA